MSVFNKTFYSYFNRFKSYKIYYNNALSNPHSGHNASSGGITASTGFGITGQTGLEFFFDDDDREQLENLQIG